MDYKLNIDSVANLGFYVFMIYYKSKRYYIRACRDKNDKNVSFSLLLVKIDQDNGYVI